MICQNKILSILLGKEQGKDYVVDENWRLSIQEGVICTPARVDIIELSN